MTRKELLIVVILTFITVCAWVVFDILHTRSHLEVSSGLEDIEPIDPNFDLSGLK